MATQSFSWQQVDKLSDLNRLRLHLPTLISFRLLSTCAKTAAANTRFCLYEGKRRLGIYYREGKLVRGVEEKSRAAR